ncbi:MAG: hypothetical protein QM775_24790 [Pirellulales bacterium]
MILADPSALAAFGRVHPLLLHAPLGLLPAIALLEFGALLLRREVPRGAVRALAVLCAVAAALTAGSGLVLGGEPGYDLALLAAHQRSGLALGAACLVLAIASGFANRLALRVALVVALGLSVPTGHLGGSLTHGPDFLFPSARPAPAATPPATAAASDFERTIRPILERTCARCHDAQRKKGKLVLTTADGIQRGGKSGPALLAGKPGESLLLRRCELPATDDDHMPPADEEQPTPAELAALRWWIAAGAPF